MSTRIVARQPRRAVAVIALAIVAVSVFGALRPDSAHAAGPTGSVSGHLIRADAPGQPFTVGSRVTVTNVVGGAELLAGVQSDGSYTVEHVPAGRYVVEATFRSCETCIPTVWAGDTVYRSQAQVVTVGDSVTIVDITTRDGAEISGTVTIDPSLTEVSVLATAHLVDPYTGRLSEWIAWGAVSETDGSYIIRGLPDGEYLIHFAPQACCIVGARYGGDTDWIADSDAVTISGGLDQTGVDATFDDTEVLTTRYSGADRFAMAVGISQEYAPGVDTVYITNGLNYPDALSAGPVAARAGGPILLVTPSGIPAVVAAELERLQPASIVVVGGPNSVNPSVVTALGAYTDDVTRIDGADRFAASRNLVADAFDEADTVYIATGHNFADALAAGGAAANEGAPVILVDGWATSVDAQTAALLADLSTRRVVIAGGPASLTPQLFDSLAALPGVEEIYRRTGASRYDAAAAINGASFQVADTVMLATGANFPDALAGGPLAGAWGAPVFLVQKECVPFDALWRIIQLQPRHIVLLGGPNSISAAVESLPMCPIPPPG